METNKAEAELDFKIAQHKIYEKDYSGAKRAALRSRGMNPEQEGMEQLLEILNVLVYVPKEADGDCDWYGILGVDPSDSEDAIRIAYKRKSLVVHPDKNKMPGAGDAFDLVKKAWNLLRDQDLRAVYDLYRRGMQVYQETPVTDMNPAPSAPFASGAFNFMFPEYAVNTSGSVPFASSTSDATYSKNDANPTPPPKYTTPLRSTQKPQTVKESNSQSNPKPRDEKETSGSNLKPQARKYSMSSNFEKARPANADTFWTVCTNCRMKYEYERIFKNAKLTCHAPSCKKFFPAIEISPPRKVYKRKQSASQDTPKSNKSTPSQATPASAFKIPKPHMPPISATPITIVPGYATARYSSGTLNTESWEYTHEENMEAIFLGQRVPSGKGIRLEEPSGKDGTLKNDLGKDINAATNVRDKGKGVVKEEPSRKKRNSFF